MQFASWVFEQTGAPPPTDENRYLLVDLSPMHGTDEAITLTRLGPAIDVLRLDAPNWEECAAPVLVDISRLAEDSSKRGALRRLLQRWAYANMAALIESTVPHEEMAHALQMRMEVQLDDGLDILLRFFDTRILRALLDVLSAEQRAALFAKISLWAFQQRDGDRFLQRNPDHLRTAVAQLPIHLSETQQLQLISAAEADGIIELLHRRGSTTLGQMLPHQQHARVTQSINNARTYGIDDAPDQAAFCSLDIELGTDFHRQPPWHQKLAEVKEKRIRFGQMLGRIQQEELPE